MSLAAVAKGMMSELAAQAPQSRFRPGDVVKHWSTDKQVKIKSGAYLVEGRLSNFFDWQEVLPNGTLGPVQCGYWGINEKWNTPEAYAKRKKEWGG